ncbi:unnamed protein product [Moneuplotes crassus]|uniref:Uncharacterized protein n=1 Tax=Euplotes crassus TaxID=5936 RepID=A0AAD1UFR7_EUPCR|nr:unnamed protein product [Moneuplotes crassus]
MNRKKAKPIKQNRKKTEEKKVSKKIEQNEKKGKSSSSSSNNSSSDGSDGNRSKSSKSHKSENSIKDKSLKSNKSKSDEPKSPKSQEQVVKESPPEPLEDVEFTIPINCPDYVKDIIEGFKENKDELYQTYNSGILTKDIHVFEKQVETILGAEICILRDYILQKHRPNMDMYKIKFNEFQKLIQEWANSESLAKDLNDELLDLAPSQLEHPNSEDEAIAEEQEEETKENFKKLIELKIEKHHEKIKEIFENYMDTPPQKEKIEEKKDSQCDSDKKSDNDNESKTNSDDGKSSKSVSDKSESNKSDSKESNPNKTGPNFNQMAFPNASPGMGFKKTIVKLNKMGKILNDIAYLTGLGIMTAEESRSKNKPKRSSAKAIDEFTHFIWLEKHNKEIRQKQRERMKKTILKNPINNSVDNAAKNNSDSESEEESKASKKGESSDAVKKGPKNAKESPKKKEVKKGNKNVNKSDSGDSSSEDDKQDDVESAKGSFRDSPKAILFQDEKYKKELEESETAYEDFQADLLAFVDQACTYRESSRDKPVKHSRDIAHRLKELFVIVDLTEEFEDDLPNDNPESKLNGIKGDDKLTRKIHKTIFEYETLIKRDDFGSLDEKNDAKKLLGSLRTQLDHHMHHNRPHKKDQETVEEKRNRTLQEIFSFYAKQHIPPGLPFEELEDTLKTINIGELLVFCKDFGIKIPRSNLMLMYKKEAERNLPHKFPQFLKTLHKISLFLHKRDLISKRKRLKEVKKLLGEAPTHKTQTGSSHSSSSSGSSSNSGSDSDQDEHKEKTSIKQKKVDQDTQIDSDKLKKSKKAKKAAEKENEKSTHKSKSKKSHRSKSSGSSKSGSGSSSNSDSSSNSGDSDQEGEVKEDQTEPENKLEDEKDQLEDQIFDLQEKNEDDIYEDFIKFLEIDAPSKYKRKAKGIRLAFDVKDHDSRIPLGLEEIRSKKNKKRIKVPVKEIKEKVRKMKEDRLNQKLKRETAEKAKMKRNRETMRLIHDKLRHERKYETKLSKINYSDIKKKQSVNPNWENPQTKVTLDLLQQMHYSDFNIEADDDFKPTDILNNEDAMIVEKGDKARKKIRSNIRLNNTAVISNISHGQSPISKRGVQMNQSQMSHKRTRSTINVKKIHKPINQAYDYTFGRVNDSNKSMAINHGSGHLINTSPARYQPRSKQVMVNRKLNVGKSQENLKQNRSVHLRRPPMVSNSMSLHNGYQPTSQKKLSYMQKQMQDRMKQIESHHKAKERYNMNGIMLMHDKQISKGLKTLNKNKYGY